MEIILSTSCASLTGALGSGFGYYIRRSTLRNGKHRYYSQRSKSPNVPNNGHWRFIVACAQLATYGLHIANIKLDWSELRDALREAHHWVASDAVFRNADRHVKRAYDALDVLNLKTTFGL